MEGCVPAKNKQLDQAVYELLMSIYAFMQADITSRLWAATRHCSPMSIFKQRCLLGIIDTV